MWMREQKREKKNRHIYYPTSQGNLFSCKAFRRYMKKNEVIYRIDFHKTIGIHTAAEGLNNPDTQELKI